MYDFSAFAQWNSEQTSSQQQDDGENNQQQQWEIMLVLQISMKNVVENALTMLEQKMYSNNEFSDSKIL
jgi:hypothetical protein